MTLLILSFIAGVLTVLAPCTLPLLPIIIGGSLQDEHNRRKPVIITVSLAVSIILFTVILKFSTALVDIPFWVWSYISGGILIIFGLISLFPSGWEKFSGKFNLVGKSNKLLSAQVKKKTYWGEMLLGAALGPVFSSCSPTYFVILATVLPENFVTGLIYLLVYAAGLALVLLLIAFMGQKFVRKIQWAANPNGWFKRGLGILFLLVGIFIFTGTDKKVQTAILDKGYFNISKVEDVLLKQFNSTENKSSYPHYHEIKNPSGFINTAPFTLQEKVGKKVILLDFMTYSCINCIRTLPYLNAWYDKYKDQGLEIIGIHAPEFSFERKRENVVAAIQSQGIKFPIVLDNDFGTWQAYHNQYWPTKYLIDINGNVVYTHSGEGNYEEVEKKIQELLRERQQKFGLSSTLDIASTVQLSTESPEALSPEMYFGSGRNEYLGNGESFMTGVQNFSAPSFVALNRIYLTGSWNFDKEYAENKGPAKIIIHYFAKSVYMVANSKPRTEVKILRDGKVLGDEAGKDLLKHANESVLPLKEDRLYKLIQDEKVGEHTLEIIIDKPGPQFFTFTFG